MRHLAELREDRLNQSGDMADFRFFISILDFQKLEILIAGPVWRPNMRHRAKFHEDRSSHSRDMANFDFSRWRPSAILDLFYACWDHPRIVFGGLCDCAKLVVIGAVISIVCKF